MGPGGPKMLVDRSFKVLLSAEAGGTPHTDVVRDPGEKTPLNTHKAPRNSRFIRVCSTVVTE